MRRIVVIPVIMITICNIPHTESMQLGNGHRPADAPSPAVFPASGRLGSAGQRETAVRQRVDQAVGHQAVKRAGPLGVIGPDRVEPGERHRVG